MRQKPLIIGQFKSYALNSNYQENMQEYFEKSWRNYIAQQYD